MPSEGRGILSPVRLPVPPLQQVYGSFEFSRNFGKRTVLENVLIREERYGNGCARGRWCA